MKKKIALLIACTLFFAVGICACGGDDADKSTDYEAPDLIGSMSCTDGVITVNIVSAQFYPELSVICMAEDFSGNIADWADYPDSICALEQVVPDADGKATAELRVVGTSGIYTVIISGGGITYSETITVR